MKATVDRDDLRSGLKNLKRSTKRKGNVLKALDGVKIEASGGTVTLEGTDLGVSYRRTLKAQAHDDGAVLIPFKVLDTLVRKLDRGSSIEFVTDDEENVEVRTPDGFRGYLRLMPLEDYPKRPTVDGEHHDATAIIPYLRSLSRCTRTPKPKMKGYVEYVMLIEDCALATDSYRMLAVETELGEDHGYLTPEAARAIAMANPDRLTVASDEHRVKVADDRGNSWIVHQPDDVGGTPSWRKLLPEDGERGWVDSESLTDGLDRLSALTSLHRNTPVRFDRSDDGRPVAQAGNQEVGHAEQVVDGEWPEVTIAFNPRFLTTVTDALGGPERMWVYLRDGLKPAVFEPGLENDLIDDSPRVRYLLMPMKIS